MAATMYGRVEALCRIIPHEAGMRGERHFAGLTALQVAARHRQRACFAVLLPIEWAYLNDAERAEVVQFAGQYGWARPDRGMNQGVDVTLSFDAIVMLSQ